MALNDYQILKARQAAVELVLKTTLNAVDQIAPNAGLKAALLKMIDLSKPTIVVGGDISDDEKTQFANEIVSHANEIVRDGLK